MTGSNSTYTAKEILSLKGGFVLTEERANEGSLCYN